MKSWPLISLPPLPFKLNPLSLRDTEHGITQIKSARFFSMYVCGITPYDATHLGHAATYLSFDLINRYLTLEHTNVSFIENVTDIDDPLLERANKSGVDWKRLADEQLTLFKNDMAALRIIPPDNLIKVTDSMDLIQNFIKRLESNGFTYSIDNDIYFSVESFLKDLPIDLEEAIRIFSQRGGDPHRAEKKHPLDPLLWLGNKDNEPGWNSTFGLGRPGWHVECTAIALEYLDREDQDFVIDLQGGGSDLIFPHHFMSAQLIKAATGRNFARHFIHTGMIGYEGEKMSKSKGNLVFVSKLLEQGIDPLVIRWALLKGHYQTDRNWTDELLMQASTEVELVRSALSKSEVVDPNQCLKNISDALANNLDTESALEMIIKWSQESLDLDKKGEFVNSAGLMSRGIDALLGLSF